MTCKMTEQSVKLELLSAVAKSQLALAGILESIGRVADHSGQDAKLLRDNIGQLTRLQEVLLGTAANIQLREKRYSEPGAPWLSDARLGPWIVQQGR